MTLSEIIQDKDKRYNEQQLLAFWLKSLLNQERYWKLLAQLLYLLEYSSHWSISHTTNNEPSKEIILLNNKLLSLIKRPNFGTAHDSMSSQMFSVSENGSLFLSLSSS